MKIVVAMSGGVDSSVAAALLAEQGHEVIGLSMQLYDQSEGQTSFGSCCSLDDLYDARRVATAIGIPHYILNFEREFDEQVVSNFVQRVRGRPHAYPLRALQQRPEVRNARRSRRRLRRRRSRDGPLCTYRAGRTHGQGAATGDGAGGVIVSWHEAAPSVHVFAQRLSPTGNCSGGAVPMCHTLQGRRSTPYR